MVEVDGAKLVVDVNESGMGGQIGNKKIKRHENVGDKKDLF